VFRDPPYGGNQPDDRAEHGAAREEQEPQTSGAKVAVSRIAQKTRRPYVTEQSKNERTGAESRGAGDQKKVLNDFNGST
jgi:hypothetical protein